VRDPVCSVSTAKWHELSKKEQTIVLDENAATRPSLDLSDQSGD